MCCGLMPSLANTTRQCRGAVSNASRFICAKVCLLRGHLEGGPFPYHVHRLDSILLNATTPIRLHFISATSNRPILLHTPLKYSLKPLSSKKTKQTEKSNQKSHSSGDALIRDVRGLHKGTANYSPTTRPMGVLGYSISWLRRPVDHTLYNIDLLLFSKWR